MLKACVLKALFKGTRMTTEIDADIVAKADTEALLKQGWQHYHGENAPQDFVIAAQCWQKAADSNNTLAMYNLACLYMHGQGVDLDHAKGLELLQTASALGSVRARDALRDVAKVSRSHFNVACKDINFERRRLYIIIGLIILLALVAAAIIKIPNRFGLGGM